MEHNIRIINSAVETISGIGDKTKEHLNRLKIFTIKDLIFYFPFAQSMKVVYEPNKELNLDHTYIFKLKIKEISSNRNNFYILTEAIDNKIIKLIFFNFKPYHIINNIELGEEYLFVGKPRIFKQQISISHPDFYKLSQQHLINVIEPKYHLTYGLSSSLIQKLVQKALVKLTEFEEWIPKIFINKFNWPDLLQALHIIHMLTPSNGEGYNNALNRLAFDEIVARQKAVKHLRDSQRHTKQIKLNINQVFLQHIYKLLPFELTEGQIEATQDIIKDIESETPMFRLLQGDVGAGKTVVALLTLLITVQNGYQGALLVPTDILATQHYVNIVKFTEILGFKTTLLKGSLKNAARKEAIEAIEKGEAQIIIGTHAIIQPNIYFHNLKTVVIDEQHRFGVLQRQELLNKGQDIELLLMSATPIPRTMMLASLGDIDVSTITTKPKGRKEIITTTVSIYKINEILASLKNIIAQAQKIYWVCSLIEENEDEEIKAQLEQEKVTSAINRYNFLSKHFPSQVTLVHSKLSNEEKQANMKLFAETNDVNVLVATTVIEVGVDVKQATVIIIENAERFGLAQLHQLRGRVGRNDLQSYCILVYGPKISEIGKQRLEIMKNSNDGFYIAEQDLLLRGGGDIIGTKQSGEEIFKIAEFPKHNELLSLAYNLTQQQASIENENLLIEIYSNNNHINFA